MTQQPSSSPKQLLGYQLRKKIGAGGYGEVWSAEAPGGMTKAVKLIYGFHDETRAQTELKALDRIKEVRHPFLLSLERIDVFEGQRVVVTELADNSLADAFDQYVAQGETGIPREELLGYIRDAAEGLDYLSETHSLQHLDVKPENLLIVSKHVKVADFGLVKDLNGASQSLMSGMTPAYAAPELFDGQPGRHSDQYSLAIVYCEMLTGRRPFPGTTPAQLAAQHMHGRPNLRNLPPGDQPIIAKALSKDPSVRFANCRAMVEDLINRKLQQKRLKRVGALSKPRNSEGTIHVDRATRDVTAVISKAALPFQSAEMKSLEPPLLDESPAAFRPTLILTIGNTANRVALSLKQRLLERYHTQDSFPAMQMRAFDSDRNELTRLTLAGDNGSLSDHEAVAVPLQTASEYRDRGAGFPWLSRRWIYNIPKTMQTEGLRPLGRLAFADHFENICQSLQQAIQTACQDDHIEKTADTLGMPVSKLGPRVFIVSSISGGLGSGMTLDLSYTVKLLLAEAGQPDDSVTGIMLHSVNHRSREAGLANANVFSFLTELRHFNDFGFPGDESLGMPELSDEPPLDYVYFQDLGNDVTKTRFDYQLDRIAEYIIHSSASPCSGFFDKCRSLADEQDEHFNLRTFGLDICGPGNGRAGTEAINRMGRTLVSRWMKGDPDHQKNDFAVLDQWMNDLEMHVDGISNKFALTLDNMIDEASFSQLRTGLQSIVASLEDGNPMSQLNPRIDEVLGCPPEREEIGGSASELGAKLGAEAHREATEIAGIISEAALNLLNNPRLDIARPDCMLKQCVQKIGEIEGEVVKATEGCRNQLMLLGRMLGENNRKDPPELKEQQIEALLQFRTQQTILIAAGHFCRVARSAVSKSIERTRNYIGALKTMSDNRFPAAGVGLDASEDDEIESLMISSVHDRRSELLENIEEQIREEIAQSHGGYQQLLNDPNFIARQLPGLIQASTRRILGSEYRRISLDKTISASSMTADKLFQWINERLNLARPTVYQCGGGNRLLVATPSEGGKSCLGQLIENQFKIQSCSIPGTTGDVVLCFEGEKVPLAAIAFRILGERPDVAQLAVRIHSRTDVDWTSLDELMGG